MARPRDAYEVEVSDGRTITMVELRTGELRQSLQLAGNDKNPDARAMAQSLEGLRMAIRKIDGRDVTRADLVGAQLDEEFAIRDISLLGEVFRRIHNPDPEAIEALEGEGIRAVSGT